MDRPGRWDKSDSINNTRVQTFKQLLLSDPNIESVAMSDEIPGKGIRFPQDYRVVGSRDNKPVAFKTMGIDDDFVHALNMGVIAGRNFSKQFKTDYNTLMVTQSAAELLGFKNPQDIIGKQLEQNNNVYAVVGVVNDFHQVSLETKAEPIVFGYNGSDFEANEFYLVKLKTTNISQTITHVQSTWADVFNNNPFGFFFLDAFFNQQYKNDVQFGLLFGVFSLIAIIIACIGLFALTAFMIEQRRKEIGVRKVLGAGIHNLAMLLTSEFIRLILVSNIIAWPLGWLMLHAWLMDFAYRINIQLWVFALAGAAALVVALLAIGYQAVKAAIANPIKSLRME
jgi:putative ABC transport system permease protein